MHLVGNEINEFEASKVAKRSMFDKNVVYHFQSLEHSLDYTFSHLGLSADSSIDYPLLLTEAMCNPNYSRQASSEILFEAYHIPALSYCVDSLLAFHYNTATSNIQSKTGIIIDSSHTSTHIIPVLDSQFQLPCTKRLQLGGLHHNDLLGKSLSLKYPQHKQQLTGEVI
jgi:actin-related protein 5